MAPPAAPRPDIEQDFWAKVAALGGKPAVGARYVNTKTKVDLVCAQGHDCSPLPKSVRAGQGLCPTCAGRGPDGAEKQFWAKVAELGGTPAAGAEYRGGNAPVKLICPLGHPCAPHPQSLRSGQGMCRTCSGKDPAVAEAKFWERLREIGGSPVAGATYRNGSTKVSVVCAAGHPCSVSPASVIAGQGICRTCVGLDPKVAEAKFWERVRELGAAPAPGAVYVNTTTPVPLICAAGHNCAPAPNPVNQGHGVCRTCAKNDPADAERRFWDRVAELGGAPAPDSVYAGRDTPVGIVCRAGHTRHIHPSVVLGGGGLCRVCIGLDFDATRERFLTQLREAGSAPAPGAEYTGAHQRVEVVCRAGHTSRIVPSQFFQTGVACREPRASFDRLYLLRHPATGAIKVGVASHHERVRNHSGRGYELVAQWSGLEHDEVRQQEQLTLRFWRELGAAPVAGVPKDGRTETAPVVHLPETLEFLTAALGEPDTDASAPPRCAAVDEVGLEEEPVPGE